MHRLRVLTWPRGRLAEAEDRGGAVGSRTKGRSMRPGSAAPSSSPATTCNRAHEARRRPCVTAPTRDDDGAPGWGMEDLELVPTSDGGGSWARGVSRAR